jgi:hypothetical protein
VLTNQEIFTLEIFIRKQGEAIAGGATIYIKHLGNAWITLGGLDGGQTTN